MTCDVASTIHQILHGGAAVRADFGHEVRAAGDGVESGSDGWIECSPRHQTHCKPSFLEAK